MNYELAIINDKFDDLESQVIELKKTVYQQKKSHDANISAFNSLIVFLLPLVAVGVILMGLEVNYQSDNHQISYTNDSFIELALSGLTLVSGAYTLKKHRDKEKI